jgi:5'-nucleotidase
MPTRKILVTNDDGVRSEGIRALADALRSLGDVTIVAPDGEASAIGHALTLARPLRLEEVGPRIYCVDGTPTDCVNVAVVHLFDGKPDLVVSGINKGWNIGDDITYSGTVAGAMEGALLGIPAIAVSLRRTAVFDFEPAARAGAAVARVVLEAGLPPRTFLNVNVPMGEPRGWRTTVQAERNHVTQVLRADDPRGRPYYWIHEGHTEWVSHDQSDYEAVQSGYVSVTPLQPNLTAHAALDVVARLLPAFDGQPR